MTVFKNFFIFLIVLFLAGSIYSEPASREMNLHDFMEDYTEIAMKKAKKGNTKYLERVLKEIPNLALSDAREKWLKISNTALKTKEFKASCKSCHKLYKKSYKKTYRKRLVTIPADLIILFKELDK